jgi:hypothetical protein
MDVQWRETRHACTSVTLRPSTQIPEFKRSDEVGLGDPGVALVFLGGSRREAARLEKSVPRERARLEKSPPLSVRAAVG